MTRASNTHVAVIGAGVGGLAAALRLAHAGAQVTVFEQAAGPGGKMRVIDSAAGPIDAGPTVFTMRSVFEALFAEVDETLEDHLTLAAEPLLARHWWADGAQLDLHADPERSAAAVRDFAGPRAEAEYRRFDEKARVLFDAFDAPVMRAAKPDLRRLSGVVMRDPLRLLRAMAPLATLAQSLARDFTDPRLRQLFGRYATYVGGSPLRAPAILALIWRAEALGVWRVRGGMHALAQALARLAETRGARFRYQTAVTEIDMRDGAVSGVRLADGDRVAVDSVLFNGDPRALHTGLLGSDARRAVRRAGVSPRALSAYVWTFAARPSGRDLAHHNVFFGREPYAEFRDLDAARMPRDPTLYICAQDRGGSAAPAGLERFEIIMNGPPVADGALKPELEEISRCRTEVFDMLARMGLRFDPAPEETALTTPQDFARLFPGSAGSLYGRSPHGMTATFARPTARTRISGLYLAGGGAHPGAGVPMAALSGRRAAEAILTDRTSTSTFRRTATPGGMSMASPTTARAPSRSSVS